MLDSKLLDFVVLVTKYYIYKCFVSQTRPNKDDLIEEIKYLEKIEKDIATRKGKLRYHNEKWGVLATLGFR